MKLNIKLRFLWILVILPVLIPSHVSAMVSVGIKNWIAAGGRPYLTEALGDMHNGSKGTVYYSSGFAITKSLNSENSLSINTIIGTADDSTAYYGTDGKHIYNDDTETYLSENSFNIFSIYNIDMFITNNRKLNSMFTFFYGIKAFIFFNSGTTQSNDENRAGFTFNTYSAGPGSGISMNNQIIGNVYLLSSVSYTLLINYTDLKYSYLSSSDDDGVIDPDDMEKNVHTENGGVITHSPMVKTGIAYYLSGSQMTFEIGIQGRLYYHQFAFSEHDAVKNCVNKTGIQIGPVFNVTRIF